jgi:cytochrome c-type biogenesis protein CcmF
MTGELGQLALCLALALSLVQGFAGFTGASRGNVRLMAMGRGAALGSFVFIALAFFTLMFAYVTSDFSVQAVAENSHTAKPLIYKISGVWGNHEGSMILWLLILAVYSAAIAMTQPTDNAANAELGSRALGVQALIAIAFLVFVLLTSDPFGRLYPPPFEGSGLNPLLQDPGLAFHPPLLYLGYVGLSASFSFAVAALIDKRNDAAWVRRARPFAIAAWTALTLGIAAGSWWAYYTLGWGGFWFWDPVENASLMPWLVCTALIHSMMATERTGAFKSWTLLLSITAFSFSLIGTFLVRSGVLNSVHSFANDPRRGLFILMILFVAITAPLVLFAWRAPKLAPGAPFDLASRETGILLNNLLLTAAAATILTGTLYPLVLDAAEGIKISVGPPYFTATVVPMFALLAILMPLGPIFMWRRTVWRVSLY